MWLRLHQTSGVREHQEGSALQAGLVLVNLAEQSIEAVGHHGPPPPAQPPLKTAREGEKNTRNVSRLRPEDFRFLCLGGRNTPSGFIAPYISEGAVDPGPTWELAEGPQLLCTVGTSVTIHVPRAKCCSGQTTAALHQVLPHTSVHRGVSLLFAHTNTEELLTQIRLSLKCDKKSL